MKQHLAFAAKMIENGGPEPSEYKMFADWISTIGDEIRMGKIDAEDIKVLRESFGDVLSILTVQGFILKKPHGYPGDYEIIEKIYLKHVSTNPKLRKWDQHVQDQEAAIAVRNRKQYVIQLFENLTQIDKERESIDVLNIASGPCRDLLEFFEKDKDGRIKFDNVEFDPLAISYAKNLCNKYEDRISFLETNAFNFSSDKKYRLIWSAGLFDYLNDKKFIFLLRRILPLIDDDGEIVIGNFSTDNPTKDYMEILGEWRLRHRSKDDLLSIGKKCGFDKKDMKIGKEPGGVNFFLHIKQGKEFIPHPEFGGIVK